MNKIYKTVWNAVRQQFVVADEAQNTRGKPAKVAVALTVVAAALCSTMASAAYVEPGFVANSRLQMDEAKELGPRGTESIRCLCARLSWPGRQSRHDGLRVSQKSR